MKTVNENREELKQGRGAQDMKYQVIKHAPSHPAAGSGGPGPGTCVPEQSVVMSQHRSREAAVKAMKRYDRDHRGYATFELAIETK